MMSSIFKPAFSDILYSALIPVALKQQLLKEWCLEQMWQNEEDLKE